MYKLAKPSCQMICSNRGGGGGGGVYAINWLQKSVRLISVFGDLGILSVD